MTTHLRAGDLCERALFVGHLEASLCVYIGLGEEGRRTPARAIIYDSWLGIVVHRHVSGLKRVEVAP